MPKSIAKPETEVELILPTGTSHKPGEEQESRNDRDTLKTAVELHNISGAKREYPGMNNVADVASVKGFPRDLFQVGEANRIHDERASESPQSGTLHYLNPLMKEMGNRTILNLISSPSFNTLIRLRRCMKAEQVVGDRPKLIWTMEEIESNLFWDSALDGFASKQLEKVPLSQKPSSPDMSNELPLTENQRFGSVPPSVGWRNRLTVWQAVYTRLIDRAVLSSVLLDLFHPDGPNPLGESWGIHSASSLDVAERQFR